MHINETALRTGYLVATPAAGPVLGDELSAAFIVELANLGFIVTNPDKAKEIPTSQAEDTLNAARAIVGTDRDTTPIYPGFPQQVKDLPTVTLIVEQILHYLSGGTLLPDYPDVIREGLSLDDAVRSGKKVEIIDQADYSATQLASLMLRANAFSEVEKQVLRDVVGAGLTEDEVVKHYTTTKNHENAHSFVNALINTGAYDPRKLFSTLASSTYNITRLLRLYLAIYTFPLDGFDESYAKATENLLNDKAFCIYHTPVPRKNRVKLINRIGDITHDFRVDEMLKHKELWQRIIRHIHGFDYQKNADAVRAMNIVNDNIAHTTFNSLVEQAMTDEDAVKASTLLIEHRPSEMLRRAVALMRLPLGKGQVSIVVENLHQASLKAPFTTLISAYNGILNANEDMARLTRVAGRNNTVVSKDRVKIPSGYQTLALEALKQAMVERLKGLPAPKVVGTHSELPVPLVARDAATTDYAIDRGAEIDVAGTGDVLRLFSHWTAQAHQNGYVDLGVVFLDEDFNHMGALTWNTWDRYRDLGTYSGDKHVYAGDSAAEYYDIELSKVDDDVRYLAVTLQSWSGYPLDTVDMIAGAMFRSAPDSGEVFEPRSIVSAFQPTVSSLQAVPYVFDMVKMKLVWLDSSSGSMKACVSADTDNQVGDVVRSELGDRLTFGDLAQLWADAHGVAVNSGVNADVDALREFLGV